MEAMIFAAGIGSRLKPFTDSHPKALVPLGPDGTTAIDMVIDRVVRAGTRHIVINVHHFAGQVTDHLKKISLPNNIKIDISDESDCLLNTGGGLRKASRFFSGDEPILIHNTDIITDIDLKEMVSRLNTQPDIEALLLTQHRSTSRYLLFDGDKHLKGWIDTSRNLMRPASLTDTQTSAWDRQAFGGIHLIRPLMLDSLASYRHTGIPFSIIDYYIDTCHDHTYQGWHPDSPFRWHDIGTPEKLEATRRDFFPETTPDLC